MGTLEQLEMVRDKRRGQPPVDLDDPHGIGARMEAIGYKRGRGAAAELSRLTGIDHQRIEALMKRTPTGRIPHSHALGPVFEALEALEQGKANGAESPPASEAFVPPPRRSPVKGSAVVYLTAPHAGGGTALTRTAHSVASVPDWLDAVEGVFGVVVRDLSMAPIYRPGDRLILNPAGIPQPGTFVAVLSADGELRIREYAAETGDGWTLRRYGTEPSEEVVLKEEAQKILTVAAVYPGR